MTEKDRDVLRDAIEILNGPFGGEAVWFLEQELAQPGNEEAEALMSTMWDPVLIRSLN